MTDRRKKLLLRMKAFTMPELLVYMVVAGVVFMIVMEGFGLFNRYAERTAERITGGSRFYENYHRLASLCRQADSIAVSEFGTIDLFSSGAHLCVLEKVDSILIHRKIGVRDTLFDCVAELDIIMHVAADTVAVSFARWEQPHVRIAFAIEPARRKDIDDDLDNQEKKYRYEPEPEKK